MLILITGCNTFGSRRPEYLQAKTFTFPASQDELWDVTAATLQLELVPLAEQDASRRTITTKQFPIRKAEFQTWVKNARFSPSGFGTLYLRILPEGQTTSKLEISVDFQGPSPTGIRKKGKDYDSTGVFERALAVRIHALLVAKKYPTLFQLAIGCNFKKDEDTKQYRVSNVEAGGFGEEQGFRESDVVLKVDGTDVSVDNFFEILSQIRQSTTKTFTLERAGSILELPVHIFYLDSDIPWIGFRVERDANAGVFRVTDVAPSSPAGEAGIQTGDMLLEEQEIPLVSWRNYYEAVTSTTLGFDRTFVIQRDEKKMAITVRPKPFEAGQKKMAETT